MAQGAQKPMVGGMTISQLPHPKLNESRRLHAVVSPYTSEPCSVWTCACGCDVKLIGVDKGAIERIQQYGAARFYADNHAMRNPDKGVTFLSKYDPETHRFKADPPPEKAGAPAMRVTEGVPVRKEPAGTKTRLAEAAAKLFAEGRVHVGIDYAKTDHEDRDVGQKSFDFCEFDAEVDAAPFARFRDQVDVYRASWREQYNRLLYGPPSRQSMFTHKDLEHVNAELRSRAEMPDFASQVAAAIQKMRASLPLGVPASALKLQLSLDEKTWVDASDAEMSWFRGQYPLGYRFARFQVVLPPVPENVKMDLQIDEKGDLKMVSGSAVLAAALGIGE